MRGILHRDLKPENILIDSEDHPHVTDFGPAKRTDSDLELTVSGAIMGTPSYMSPEQAAGRRGSIKTATDVYGLSAILYALLAGKAPFGGDNLVDTLHAVKERPPESPRIVNPKVPRDLETICLKWLAKDPRRRYASAQALADDLRSWLDSRPIAAHRVEPAERAWLWCKRKPAVAALAASVMLAVVGGMAAIVTVQAKANVDLRSANCKLDQANSQLKSSNIALERRRTRAAEREQQAIDAIKRFRNAVGEDPSR
jgi:serine/threonine protein kinase